VHIPWSTTRSTNPASTPSRSVTSNGESDELQSRDTAEPIDRNRARCWPSACGVSRPDCVRAFAYQHDVARASSSPATSLAGELRRHDLELARPAAGSGNGVQRKSAPVGDGLTVMLH
jgi:hypothetical protein